MTVNELATLCVLLEKLGSEEGVYETALETALGTVYHEAFTKGAVICDKPAAFYGVCETLKAPTLPVSALGLQIVSHTNCNQCGQRVKSAAVFKGNQFGHNGTVIANICVSCLRAAQEVLVSGVSV
jgi:hypothetical protein